MILARTALLVVATVSAALGALFGAAFHDRYWRHRDCFNELGRCLDPVEGEVFLESAGLAWGTLTGLALFVAVAALILARRLGRRAAPGR